MTTIRFDDLKAQEKKILDKDLGLIYYPRSG
jgi:hypothetical protein